MKKIFFAIICGGCVVIGLLILGMFDSQNYCQENTLLAVEDFQNRTGLSYGLGYSAIETINGFKSKAFFHCFTGNYMMIEQEIKNFEEMQERYNNVNSLKISFQTPDTELIEYPNCFTNGSDIMKDICIDFPHEVKYAITESPKKCYLRMNTTDPEIKCVNSSDPMYKFLKDDWYVNCDDDCQINKKLDKIIELLELQKRQNEILERLNPVWIDSTTVKLHTGNITAIYTDCEPNTTDLSKCVFKELVTIDD